MSRVAVLIWALLIALLPPVPAGAQTADPQLLALRTPTASAASDYELRAEFTGTLDLVIRRAHYTIGAAGWLRQWSKPGESRRSRVTISSLQLPFILRPFAKPLGTAIEGLIETQAADPQINSHDLFILRATPESSEVAGIRADIVDEALTRYMPQLDRGSPETRQVVARWLYTAPSMQAWIRRAGPPFALAATMDGRGMLRGLRLSYDWGQVDTSMAYETVGTNTVWRNLQLVVNGDVRGVGPVNGHLAFEFQNYCVNCQ